MTHLDRLLAAPVSTTRQLSPENPTGDRGEGALSVPNPSDPDLPHSAMAAEFGMGFKVRPFIRLEAGERLTIGEIVGSGVIRSLFLTSNIPDLADLVLRIWWDGEADPAVDVSVASFFCLAGLGQHHTVTSEPIVVAPVRGCSSWWPMPFSNGARIELHNRGSAVAEVVAYTISYDETAAAPSRRFHAATRHGEPDGPRHEFTLLDALGPGIVVGTAIQWHAVSPRWWGEGEVKTYFGGDQHPTLVGTGTEDYFGGAWGFGRDTVFLPDGPGPESAFSAPYVGAPYVESNEGYEREISLYRWHIPDPISFDEHVRVAVQVLGQSADRRYELRNDTLTATGYWYQDRRDETT
jgi:hypothetical protein